MNKIEIANQALIGLGGNPITSFEEGSNEAKAVNAIWEVTRKSQLSLHNWVFAIRRQSLVKSTTVPNHTYKYYFALPADHLKTIQVLNGSDYKIEYGFIGTNAETVDLKYVADIIDTSRWSADFIELMIARLKVQLVYPITRSFEPVELLTKLYNITKDTAVWNDSSQDIPDEIPFYPEILAARNS